jgi:hypothetical protein
VRRCGLDASRSGQEQVAGSCEHENEPSSSIKGYLSDYQLLKKGSAA